MKPGRLPDLSLPSKRCVSRTAFAVAVWDSSGRGSSGSSLGPSCGASAGSATGVRSGMRREERGRCLLGGKHGGRWLVAVIGRRSEGDLRGSSGQGRAEGGAFSDRPGVRGARKAKTMNRTYLVVVLVGLASGGGTEGVPLGVPRSGGPELRLQEMESLRKTRITNSAGRLILLTMLRGRSLKPVDWEPVGPRGSPLVG